MEQAYEQCPVCNRKFWGSGKTKAKARRMAGNQIMNHIAAKHPLTAYLLNRKTADGAKNV